MDDFAARVIAVVLTGGLEKLVSEFYVRDRAETANEMTLEVWHGEGGPEETLGTWRKFRFTGEAL